MKKFLKEFEFHIEKLDNLQVQSTVPKIIPKFLWYFHKTLGLLEVPETSLTLLNNHIEAFKRDKNIKMATNDVSSVY